MQGQALHYMQLKRNLHHNRHTTSALPNQSCQLARQAFRADRLDFDLAVSIPGEYENLWACHQYCRWSQKYHMHWSKPTEHCKDPTETHPRALCTWNNTRITDKDCHSTADLFGRTRRWWHLWQLAMTLLAVEIVILQAIKTQHIVTCTDARTSWIQLI